MIVQSSAQVHCRICGTPSEHYADAVLLKRYRVVYFMCSTCGFIQTQEPYWLEDAYASAINLADVGMVQRNQRIAKISRALITLFFDGRGRFVDYGGGYGLFVRMMRDRGYDFYRTDKHCSNLFASEFEADLPTGGGYELLTAFELFEHLVDPVSELRRMLEFSNSIFFTTELLPEIPPLPETWTYFGLDHGQHVSFYTRRSLEVLAQQFGLRLYSDGKFRHLLTPKKLSPLCFRVASTYRVAALLEPLTGRSSLVAADYQRITGRKLK